MFTISAAIRFFGRFLVRAGVFAALWWLLALGAPESWTIGVPTVVAATLLSLALAPGPLPAVRLTRFPAFAFYFLRESAKGGIDVAARALRPAMPLKPGFATVPLGALESPQRLVFAVLVSLMPGTLAVRLEDDTLRVHVIDTGLPVAANLGELRNRLTALFRPTNASEKR